MKKAKVNPRQKFSGNKKHEEGYQQYPPDEDIYNKAKHDSDIDLDEISENRRITNKGIPDENDFIYDGAIITDTGFDDEVDPMDNEDEDSNFYSFTDDRIDDLEDLFER